MSCNDYCTDIWVFGNTNSLWFYAIQYVEKSGKKVFTKHPVCVCVCLSARPPSIYSLFFYDWLPAWNHADIFRVEIRYIEACGFGVDRSTIHPAGQGRPVFEICESTLIVNSFGTVKKRIDNFNIIFTACWTELVSLDFLLSR